MELDEMKLAWKELDAKVVEGRNLVAELRGELKMERAQSKLGWFMVTPVYELVMGLIAAGLIGSYLGTAPEAKFFLPALLLMITAVGFTGFSIWQIATLGSIDYSSPVVEIQKQIEMVRVGRIQVNRWVLLTAPLLWAPVMTILPNAIFGFDAYRSLGVAYVVGNWVVGLLLIPVLMWASQTVAKRLSPSALRSLSDDLAGRSLVKANSILDQIRRFELE